MTQSQRNKWISKGGTNHLNDFYNTETQQDHIFFTFSINGDMESFGLKKKTNLKSKFVVTEFNTSIL